MDEVRQSKTESDVVELKAGQTRTDIAIAKIGDNLEILTKIVSKSEADKNTALQRALGIIVSAMFIIGGVVTGSYWLINSSQDAKSVLREYRVTQLEKELAEFKSNTKVTYAWKTTVEVK